MKHMRFMSLLVGAFLLALPAFALEKDAQARKVLDAAAKVINASKGIQAHFKVTSFSGGQEQGSGTGTIKLLGKKFVVDAGEQKNWFDGKNLWTYDAGIGEVNLTLPSRKEQQTMNPYSFISIYKKGYGYTVKEVTFGGAPAYEVRLLAEKASSDLPEILLTLNKKYVPLCIRMRQGNSNWTRISISQLETGKQYTEATFTFPASEYPDAEIIDMR